METFTGTEYIKIDLANQFGLDKLLWKDRIKWATENDSKLDVLIKDADKPYLFAKALSALRDAQNGTPTGFIMGLDSTASGLQIMACLIGCEDTARTVNLINTGQREDIYQMVADTMTKVCGTEITRKEVKHPVMTTFYNSKQQPIEVFGENTPELETFYETLEKYLSGALEVMSDINTCWNSTALKHEWTLPDGHVSSVDVLTRVSKKIEVDELDHATFTHQAYINQPSVKGLSLPANVVQSIDAYIVREMIRKCSRLGFELLTIHDNFLASPNNMDQVRKCYVEILASIADSNLLQNILNELTSSNGRLEKKCTNLSKLILSSEYALS